MENVDFVEEAQVECGLHGSDISHWNKWHEQTADLQ